MPNPPQQRVAAGSQSELGAKTHASTAAERQAQGGQPGIQAPRPARPRKRDPRQALGENAALAAAIPAELKAFQTWAEVTGVAALV